MDNWRVLDFTQFSGSLHYQRGRLVVRPENEADQMVSLADVATIMLGLHVSVAAAVLHQLAAFDVVVLVCDWNGVPSGAMTAWGDHTRIAARQRAQVSMTLPRRKNAWGQIVRAKIAGQAANLQLLGHHDWRHLADMVSLVRSGDPENIEARAARYYWSRLFADFERHPGAGSENRNSMLDYGYAVLRGFGVRAVLAAGLSSTIGLFHRGRSNAFNLVDDLIEPFRPAIDYVVSDSDPRLSVNHPTVKRRMVAASSQPFTSDGHSVSSALTALAQQVGRYCEGDIDKLSVPSWSGPIRVPAQLEGAVL